MKHGAYKKSPTYAEKESREAVVNEVAAAEEWGLKLADILKGFNESLDKKLKEQAGAIKKLEEDAKTTKEGHDTAIEKLENDMLKLKNLYRERQFMLAFERRFMVKTFTWSSPWAGRTFKHAVMSFENLNPNNINEALGVFAMTDDERNLFATDFCFWFLPDYEADKPDRTVVLPRARDILSIVASTKTDGDKLVHGVPPDDEAKLVYEAIEKIGDDGKTLLAAARDLEQQDMFRGQPGLFWAPVPPGQRRKSSAASSAASSGSGRKSTR